MEALTFGACSVASYAVVVQQERGIEPCSDSFRRLHASTLPMSAGTTEEVRSVRCCSMYVIHSSTDNRSDKYNRGFEPRFGSVPPPSFQVHECQVWSATVVPLCAVGNTTAVRSVPIIRNWDRSPTSPREGSDTYRTVYHPCTATSPPNSNSGCNMRQHRRLVNK